MQRIQNQYKTREKARLKEHFYLVFVWTQRIGKRLIAIHKKSKIKEKSLFAHFNLFQFLTCASLFSPTFSISIISILFDLKKKRKKQKEMQTSSLFIANEGEIY